MAQPAQSRLQLDWPDVEIESKSIWDDDGISHEKVVDAVKGVKIVIMNPPYTSRAKMGEKFETPVKVALRNRIDMLEQEVIKSDPEWGNATNRTALGPMFRMLGDQLTSANGVVTSVIPTIACTSPAGINERILLANRHYIHTILTCHQPGNGNLSQNSGLSESILVMIKWRDHHCPTRFINLDKLPTDDDGVEALHTAIRKVGTKGGEMPGGWGVVSYWLPERIKAGDWSPAVFRAPELAEAAYWLNNGLTPHRLSHAERAAA